MLLGNRPVWDVRPLPEHFLEYAADDVRHLCALFDTMKLRHGALLDASERISEEYCGFYARADCKPVEAEADTKSQNVRTEWLERYFGPAGVCGFCGARGHHEAQCFRKAAAGGGANNFAAAAAASSASSASATAVKDEASAATTTVAAPPPSSGKSVLRCSHCGGLGHLSTSCFKKNPALLKCTHCGQMGHVATHCFVKNPCPHCGGKHKPEKCLKRALLSPEEQDQQQQPRS